MQPIELYSHGYDVFRTSTRRKLVWLVVVVDVVQQRWW